jgi:hypothetical protein
VWWLEHLSGIEGMEVRIVVGQAMGRGFQNQGNRLRVKGRFKGGKRAELPLK